MDVAKKEEQLKTSAILKSLDELRERIYKSNTRIETVLVRLQDDAAPSSTDEDKVAQVGILQQISSTLDDCHSLMTNQEASMHRLESV